MHNITTVGCVEFSSSYNSVYSHSGFPERHLDKHDAAPLVVAMYWLITGASSPLNILRVLLGVASGAAEALAAVQ